MTATQTREAAVIEEKLRALMDALGIVIPQGYRIVLESPAWGALKAFAVRHPFLECKQEYRAAEPFMASVEWQDGVRETFMLSQEHTDA